jgi:hypothetical protein
MIDIDQILAAAIRNALLQVNGPAPRSQFRVEVETARRIRSALEREGVIITEARPMPEAGWISVQPSGLANRQSPRRTADR